MKQTVIKTLICVSLAITSLAANAQVKAFEKYADMKNVSYIYISKYMLAVAGKNVTPSIPKVDTEALKNKLSGIQIIHAENNGMRTKLKSDVQEIIKREKYELLMQVREDGDKADIYRCIDKEQSVVVMLVEDDDNMAVIVFSGKFTMDDVMKMTE